MTNSLAMFAGSGGGSKGGHIAKNSLFSNSDLRVLDLVSEGQIGGLVDGAKSIYFDDVPLQNQSGTYNYDNVEVDWVNGTQDQEIIKGFGDVSTPQVVGSEVRYGLPITVAIPNNDADAINVVVSLPSLYSSDSKGNINATSVQFRFELATGDSDDFVRLGDFTISGKQNSQYSRSYRFNLPQKDSSDRKPAQWLLRMTRLSGDSHERYSANTVLETIYVINSSWLNYPNSALVGVKANAENITSIPTRSYLIDGLIIKIPSNYNPATNTYNGTWDGTFKMAVSSNPAWILYALLTNERWGLGNFIKPEQVNKAKLYEIGRYCDEEIDNGYGKMEKRFSINTQVQERSDAYRLISDISAVFRGMGYWSGGMADFTCDMPTEPSMLYNASNVIDGLFTYSGSSRNDRHSVALVTWNDPEQNYKQVVEYVEDADLIEKYGIRQAELTAFGCTSRAQAIRAGRWILYTESYESDQITFSVGIDSALVLPGDVIKIQDPNYAGKRNGGRLAEVGEKYAILDAEVELSISNDTTISMRLPDGTFVERDVIVSANGKAKRVEWNDPLTTLPAKNAIWVISEASLVPITARVVNVQQGEDKNTFTITAVSHQPKKYDLIEKGIKFEEEKTTFDPLDITPPTNVNVEEVSTSIGLGYISSVLKITFLAGRNCMSHELQYRRENSDNDTDWVTIQTKSKSFEIGDIQKGTYHFILRGVGLMGNKTENVEFYYLATGKYATPLDVKSFQVIKRPSYLEVRWEPVEEAMAYEVRCGNTWDDAEVLISSFSGTSFVTYQYEAGTYNYHIRSISSAGNYSPNVTTYELVLAAPATPVDLVAVVAQGRIDFKWKANQEDDLSHYELREGQSWDTGTKVAESKVSQTSIPAGSKAQRRFWLKAIMLPKIYSDNASWVEINVENDETRNIVITHNARNFDWNSNMVNMMKSGDDIVMNSDTARSEYIARMDLGEKLTAQNTFTTVVNAVVKSSSDTETWDTASFPWSSEEALRGWRLQGDSASVGYENQIARYIGLTHEIDAWGFEDTLNSENKIAPLSSQHVSYAWGRYTKGLNMDGQTGVTWSSPILSEADGSQFKMSFWIKAIDMPNTSVMYMIMSLGNSENSLKIHFSANDGSYFLSSNDGNVISINNEMKTGQHIFIAISQTKTTRTFGVGVLGGKADIKHEEFAPIGEITWMKVGSDLL